MQFAKIQKAYAKVREDADTKLPLLMDVRSSFRPSSDPLLKAAAKLFPMSASPSTSSPIEVDQATAQLQEELDSFAMGWPQAHSSASGLSHAPAIEALRPSAVNPKTSLHGEDSADGVFDLDFDQVFGTTIGLRFFAQHLQREYSEENLHFWVEAQEFKEKRNIENLLPLAEAIANKYVILSAAEGINIPRSVRAQIIDTVESGDVTLALFDEAIRVIVRLMQNDSFPRFLKGPLYPKLQVALCPLAGNEEALAALASPYRLWIDQRPTTISPTM